MPTGYTADIEKGITFEQFAMTCARAFGALVTMRDEPHDAAIPDEFGASDYHPKALAKAEADLAALNAMTIAQADAAAQADYDKNREYHLAARTKVLELRAKYDAMLALAKAWEPPTADHQGLKRLMVEQIEQSINFDCDDTYHADALANLKREAAQDWKERRQKAVLKDIGYHAKELAEEVARAKSRTQWVRALRNSLRQHATA